MVHEIEFMYLELPSMETNTSRFKHLCLIVSIVLMCVLPIGFAIKILLLTSASAMPIQNPTSTMHPNTKTTTMSTKIPTTTTERQPNTKIPTKTTTTERQRTTTMQTKIPTTTTESPDNPIPTKDAKPLKIAEIEIENPF